MAGSAHEPVGAKTVRQRSPRRRNTPPPRGNTGRGAKGALNTWWFRHPRAMSGHSAGDKSTTEMKRGCGQTRIVGRMRISA
jgi:hypothetical protein